MLILLVTIHQHCLLPNNAQNSFISAVISLIGGDFEEKSTF